MDSHDSLEGQKSRIFFWTEKWINSIRFKQWLLTPEFRKCEFPEYFYRYKIFNQRCTRVENPGDGIAQIFSKIPWGGGGGFTKLSGQNCQGVPSFGFYCILIYIFICLGGLMFTLPPSPRCVHLCIQCKFGKIWYSCNWAQTCQISKGPQNLNMTLLSENSLEYLSEFGEYCALRSYPFNLR